MKRKNWLKCGISSALGMIAAFAFGGLTGYAAYDSALLKTCTMEGKTTIEITGTASAGTIEEGEIADDGYYYLFELQPYESELGSRTDYAAWCNKGSELKFSVPYSGKEEDAQLYSRFVTAVKVGNTYREISNPIYITNPEALASYTAEYPDAQSKKGVLIELDMIKDAMELGVKHTTINIPYHHMIGGNLEYEYNGKTYHFNEELIASYDKMVSTFSSKSIVVTAILLNGWNDAYPELHETGLEKTSTANYYGFHVSTKEGYETTRALLSFMAERYSGDDYDHGRISNWIIGNEVNNNQDWNYVGAMDLNSYTKLYEKSFRVAYTAIKSQSKNARVFFSTDYEWKRQNTDLKYAAKDFIDLFNEGICSEGNIDWGLAYHPYPHPLTEPEFWDDDQTGAVLDSVDSPIINFKNLTVLTDYFQNTELLSPSGTVRHIILSEEGFTAMSPTRGPVFKEQAAAYAYAYFLVDANPYIEAFILNRQVDAVSEYNASCAFGLWTVDTSREDKVIAVFSRPIHQVFRYIDTKKALKYTEFAKEIIGISSWSEVIPNFKLEK